MLDEVNLNQINAIKSECDKTHNQFVRKRKLEDYADDKENVKDQNNEKKIEFDEADEAINLKKLLKQKEIENLRMKKEHIEAIRVEKYMNLQKLKKDEKDAHDIYQRSKNQREKEEKECTSLDFQMMNINMQLLKHGAY
ncbi:uncharacterized protein KGF55_004899 [Candida pseudojiufengensis]|uniref:uncharacterized protein n=1 Tax=Candida pseudojiufengensis TaxID=497109 RepID=UPI0022249D29|nr:uncharacterized protein KGF55_004899 [Candida pseudojiufengensis]KAI5960176.1 hypothetical protein KGF55_004899 [Candida pseudojiufengensis]